MVEFGIVERYMEDGREFGFIAVLDESGRVTKEELFFHYGNGTFVNTLRNKPRFGEASKRESGKTKRLRSPQKGDMIVFVRGMSNGRSKAVKWAFAEPWIKHLERWTSREQSGEPRLAQAST